MNKIDHRKEFKELYSAPRERVELVDVPALPFLLIDGAGDPNTSESYQQAVSALYGMAYHLKFAVKKAQEVDYRVMPLEGLWWAEDMAQFSQDRKDDWLWTMLIMQPELISAALVEEAREATLRKKPELAGALALVRFETFAEGRCAQVLHIGPYAEEAPTIAGLHDFIAGEGLGRRGKHHEIYLSDPSRSKPETMKTILRQPVAAG